MQNSLPRLDCPRCQWSYREGQTSCHHCNYSLSGHVIAADRRRAHQRDFYLVRPTPVSLPIVTRTLLRLVDVNLGIAPSLAGDPATSRAMPLHQVWPGINALLAAGVFCRWEVRDMWSSCRILGDPSLPLYAIVDNKGYSDIQQSKEMCLIAWSRYIAKVHPIRYKRLEDKSPDWLIITTSWLDIRSEAAQLLTTKGTTP